MLFFFPRKQPDLMDEPDDAYNPMVDSSKYEAEKGLLELYRNFVMEMLRISLAGVAVLGFLTKLATKTDPLTELSKKLGATSTTFFALSSILALVFLFASSNGYRCYIAGLRAEYASVTECSSKEFLRLRKNILKICGWTKGLSAVFLGLGAITAMMAIWALFLEI